MTFLLCVPFGVVFKLRSIESNFPERRWRMELIMNMYWDAGPPFHGSPNSTESARDSIRFSDWKSEGMDVLASWVISLGRLTICDWKTGPFKWNYSENNCCRGHGQQDTGGEAKWTDSIRANWFTISASKTEKAINWMSLITTNKNNDNSFPNWIFLTISL